MKCAGEGPDAALRDGQRLRQGHRALSRWRPGRGVPAVGVVQAEEVRPQAPGGAGDGRGVRPPAGRGDGGKRGARGVGESRADRAGMPRSGKQQRPRPGPRADGDRRGEAVRRCASAKRPSSRTTLAGRAVRELLQEPQAILQEAARPASVPPGDNARFARPSGDGEFRAGLDHVRDLATRRMPCKHSKDRWQFANGLHVRIPGLPQFRASWLQSQHYRRAARRTRGRPAEALAAHEQAHAIRERLARENPSVDLFPARPGPEPEQHRPPSTARCGRPAEAIESYERSRTIFERLAREPQGHSQSDRSCLVSRQHRRPGEKLGRLSQALASREQALRYPRGWAKSRRSFRWSMTLFRLITASETCSARWVDPPMRWRRTSRPARSRSERAPASRVSRARQRHGHDLE